ncbi:MAG: alpha/beta fold hydrolase [Candidatus Thiodiazotropha sp.]
MNERALSLYYRELGSAQAPPLLLLHGLFGVSNNWMGVVKLLQEDFRLILPDLRNHGRSPHHPRMDYPAMAGDLLALLDRLRLDSVSLLGHSMGGKVAMWMALLEPERVERLVVADIAPVPYPSRFDEIFQGLQELPLAELSGRQSADQRLAGRVGQRAVRQYLLQNLVKRTQGWEWRFNLPVLSRSRETLGDFPASEGRSFAGEVLFLYGERSDYVRPEYREAIERLFPHARRRMLPAAGHWLYAEQPEAFSRAVRMFLKTS